MTGHLSWQVQAALVLSVFCMLAGLILLSFAGRADRAELRLRGVRRSAMQPTEALPEQPVAPWARVVGAVGRAVLRSGLLSRKAINDLEQTVVAGGGSRTGPALAIFVGTKLLALLSLPGLVWLTITLTHVHVYIPLAMAIGAIVGILLPDMIVSNIRKRYLKAVDTGLPATLDLLIICTEAGLSLRPRWSGFRSMRGKRPTPPPTNCASPPTK